MRKSKVLLAYAIVALLARCEIEDELEIRADGSGTYQARITVDKVVATPVLDRIRAAAERDHYRIIEEGSTFASRFIVVRKDFDDVRALSGPQSNFDMTIDRRRYFWRRYHLRATVSSVADASFDRRFLIIMPATVISTSAGGNEDRTVRWYCRNGGSIDVVAEGLDPAALMIASVVAFALIAATIVITMRVRRARPVRGAADKLEPATVCTTCHKPIAADARYCPSCGDRVLPPA